VNANLIRAGKRFYTLAMARGCFLAVCRRRKIALRLRQCRDKDGISHSDAFNQNDEFGEILFEPYTRAFANIMTTIYDALLSNSALVQAYNYIGHFSSPLSKG
jgi:hypothetical protein